MNGKKSILLALVFLLLCSSANAGLLVSVFPKNPAMQTLSLYLDEASEYEITVYNNSGAAVENIVLKVTAADGLKIIEGGQEKTFFSKTIESISANEKHSFLLKVKPSALSTKSLFLYIDYGIDNYTHLTATYLTVLDSPLQIDASLSKTALDVGDEGSLKLSFKNADNSPITNIYAELIVPDGLESMDGTVSLPLLSPGEGYEAKEFVFKADPTARGVKPLTMLISFEDSLGKHVIEKSFSVEIQSKQTIMYLIVGIIILLVFVAILSRKGPAKPIQKLETPIVKELEGKKVSIGSK